MEMLVINAINFHVADTGFFGTLDEVKFDSLSFCARKKKNENDTIFLYLDA